MIDAVLFDLGDTIINFGVGRREAEVLFRIGARLTYDYIASRHANVPTFEQYFKVNYRLMSRAYVWSKLTRRDFSYADILHKASRKLHLSLADEDLLQLSKLWYKPINDASHIDPGVRHMLEELRQAGTRLAIVSNTLVPSHCLDAHLAEEELLEFFPVRVYSSNVRYRKPHPRIFEMALKEVGVPADRALFIGDLLVADIAGAKRAGMRTIWKPSIKTAPPLFHPRFSILRGSKDHRPDFTIRRITELPNVLRQFGWKSSRQAAAKSEPRR